MKTYDLYLYATDRELILGWHRFEAEGDETAVQIAVGLAEQQTPLELWQDQSLIKRWEKMD